MAEMLKELKMKIEKVWKHIVCPWDTDKLCKWLTQQVFPVSHLPRVRFKWVWYEYKPDSGSQLLQDLEDVCREQTLIFRWSCLWFCTEDDSIFTHKVVYVGLFASDKDGKGINIFRPNDYWWARAHQWIERITVLSPVMFYRNSWYPDTNWGYPKALECCLHGSSVGLFMIWAPHHIALLAPSVEMSWRRLWGPQKNFLMTSQYPSGQWLLSGGSEGVDTFRNLVSSCFADETSIAISS